MTGNKKDVEFVTLVSERISIGSGKFVEIARTRWVNGSREGEFIAISKGRSLRDGTSMFTQRITLPDTPEVKRFIAERINFI